MRDPSIPRFKHAAEENIAPEHPDNSEEMRDAMRMAVRTIIALDRALLSFASWANARYRLGINVRGD